MASEDAGSSGRAISQEDTEEEVDESRRNVLGMVAALGIGGIVTGAGLATGSFEEAVDAFHVEKGERRISIEETRVFDRAEHLGGETYRIWLKSGATTDLSVSRLRVVRPDGTVKDWNDQDLDVGQRSATVDLSPGEYTILALTDSEELVSETPATIEVTEPDGG